jgi:hypothetical protein
MEDAIVDKVAARVLAALNGEPVDTGRRNVFVVFSGAVSGFAAGREAVGRLVRSPHELTILMTPAAKHIFGEGPLRQVGATSIVEMQPWTDVSEYTRKCDLVLVPTLTMNVATKLALGMMDTPATTLVLGALLAGKSVLAIRDGADPAGKRGEALGAIPNGSPALWHLLEERLATLERFGIRLTSKGDFLFELERQLIRPVGPRAAVSQCPVVAAGGPKAPAAGGAMAAGQPAFVTAGDLLGLAPGSVVRLGRGHRLTGQAADVVARLGLKLEYA